MHKEKNKLLTKEAGASIKLIYLLGIEQALPLVLTFRGLTHNKIHSSHPLSQPFTKPIDRYFLLFLTLYVFLATISTATVQSVLIVRTG